MPVIRYTLPDPTDVVVQGDALIYGTPGYVGLPSWDAGTGTPLLVGNVENPSAALPAAPQGTQTDYLWPDPPPPSVLPVQATAAGQPFQNAVICTPAGAIIDVFVGGPLPGQPLMSTTRWVLAGVTRDSTGAPLPSCRVIVLAEGYLAVGAQANAVLAEVISSAVDGSFSIPVPGNGGYGIIAYKPGDPPTVAGITLFNTIPTSPG